jgi:hypothetical protein
MAGYTRQSAADIVSGQVIKAEPVHNEFEQLVAAFSASTGHRHDGTSTGEGGLIPLISDTNQYSKVVVDTANNRINFFTNVGSAAVEQVRIQDGAIVPVTDEDIDLGSPTAEFKDLYIDGVGYIDTLAIHENATITGNLTVNGNTTLGSDDSDTVTVNADVASDLIPSADATYDLGATGSEWNDAYITGTANIDSLVADTADINGGTIDGTIIGNTTAASGEFTTLGSSGNLTVGGTAGITGNTTLAGTLSVTGAAGFADTVTVPGLSATGTATLATVDINAGNIDGTVIGASSAAAGSFTTVSTTGQGTFASVDINGGTIDGAIIGGTTAGAITGTTVTANTCFVGDVTGAVSGNVTGNLNGNAVGCHTGNFDGVVGATTPAAVTGTTITANTCFVGDITGDVTGTVTGNVTGDLTGDVTSVGTSTFCDINMTGTAGLDMGSAKITSLGTPTLDGDASTKCYVDQQISNLVGGAPGALDTLSELADAINNDADFYTSLTTCLGTKLACAGGTMSGDLSLGANKATSTATPATDDTLTRKGYVDTQDALKLNLTGGTMSGAIAMGTSKITGLGDPTLAQDAATKTYTDTQRDTRLACSGGTVTGTIDMGANKITTTYTPTDAADLTTKTYVDGILQSATDAATSATCAANSATAAATSETNASNSATAAATSATNAATSYDDFDDRYLGDKASDPSVDNDGDGLLTGALYWNTTDNALKVYTGSAWNSAAFTLGDALTAISDDTSPTLGGNLDANSNCITGVANICATNLCGTLTGNVTGNVTGCVSTLGNHDTDDLAEGTNQYFTTARVDSHLSGGTGVTYTSGAIAIGQAVGTADNVCFGSVCVSANPTLACQLATKEYVDTIAAAGLHYHDPVRVQTTASLSATYDNGSSGVGATLTNNGTQAAISIDGVALSSADRVLVTEQTNAYENGVYTVTTVGSGSTNWVLTRSTDTDSSAPSDPDALGQGDAFFIKEGDTNAGHLDVLSTQGTITFGTTNIVFAEVAETSIYSAGNGIALTGTSFSADAGTGVTVDGNGINIGQAVGTSDTVTFARVCAPVTGAVTGNADTASAWATARTLCVCGAVTGSTSVDGSGNFTVNTTATSDPTLCICGDATGSATFTNLGNANLSLTIADDSHNHTVANVDGLATCLSGKAATNGSTSNNFSGACICAANCVRGQFVYSAGSVCAATCVGANCCVKAPVVCASSALRGTCLAAGTCVNAPEVCATTWLKVGGRCICQSAGDYGSISVVGGDGNWPGYSIANHTVFMANGTDAGIYNDTTNEWYLKATCNAGTCLHYNGSGMLCTTSYGARTENCHCVECCLKTNVVCGVTTRGTTACFTDFNSTSDCRCKDNIATVEDAYTKLGQIRGVNYNWKDSGKYTMGVVAQEVEEAFPELVTTDDDGYKSVNYNGLVGALIETVKCLQGKVEELENGSKG